MRWEVIAADNDTMLLIIMILIDFFLKQDVLVEKGRSLFRFIVDVALNAFLLRTRKIFKFTNLRSWTII